MSFQIDEIRLRQVKMPLVHFFETSFGRTYERHMVLVEVVSDGVSGWGEVTAGENPFYNEEWTDSAWMIVRDYVAPRVLNHPLESAREVAPRLAHIRGHRRARGGVEA
ncbi:MAG: o-succinylbenzoate synthase, partial [bacterium]